MSPIRIMRFCRVATSQTAGSLDLKAHPLLMHGQSGRGIKSALGPDALVSFMPMDAVGEHGGLTLPSDKQLDEIGNGYTYFADEDVVIAKITPCFENGKGALAANLTNGVAFGTTELHVVRPGPEIDPPIYILYFY